MCFVVTGTKARAVIAKMLWGLQKKREGLFLRQEEETGTALLVGARPICIIVQHLLANLQNTPTIDHMGPKNDSAHRLWPKVVAKGCGRGFWPRFVAGDCNLHSFDTHGTRSTASRVLYDQWDCRHVYRRAYSA